MDSNSLIDFDLHYVPNVLHRDDKKDLTLMNDSNMRILYMNGRSIRCKLEEVQCLVATKNVAPDILALTETWIKDNEIKYFKMNGFNSFLAGRRNKSGGGVGILIKNGWGIPSLSEKIINDLIEVIVVEVKMEKESYVIVVIYRPPNYLNSQEQQLFFDQLDCILSKYEGKKTIILGDLNINILKESNEFVQRYLSTFLQYNRVIQNKGFITRPMFGTCIDHIITDFELVQSVFVQTLQFINLDHLVMFIDFPMDAKTRIKPVPSYFVQKSTNFEDFRALLPMNLSHINEDMNTDEIFDEIVSGINFTLNQCSRIKVSKRREKTFKSAWIDSELIKMIDLKEYWFVKMNSSKNNEFYKEEYRYWRNKVTAAKRVKKENYFGRKFQNSIGNNRKTWKCMKDVMANGQTSSNPINLFTNVQCISEKKAKLDEFNGYYSSIGSDFRSTRLADDITVRMKKVIEGTVFEFRPLSIEETKLIIMRLKNKDSSGFDGISSNLLKRCCEEISPFVNMLINKSLSTGEMPKNAKIARVIAIYKGGDVKSVSNFRPISVTSVVGKLIELAVNDQISTYVENNDILSPEQYGFRNKSNTMSACFDLTSNVCRCRDSKELTCLTFVDTAKAFNSVNRTLLLQKLENLGIRNTALKWFDNFLQDTQQFSECGILKSGRMSVECGLMQGSILSPILFNLYSCDLNMMNFSGKYYAFADDICFQHNDNSIDLLEEKVNEDMTKFEAYMNFNFLSVNVNKTKSMTISNSPNAVSVRYANQIIESVDEYKYLGLLITNNFNWNRHISKMYSNLSALAGVFRKICKLIPHELKRSLYNSMFVSHILYCIPIFGSTTNNNITLLQRCQNKALKGLYGKDQLYSPRTLMKQLNYLSIVNYYRLFTITHVHAIKHSLIHSNTRISISNHEHDTRRRNDLWLPQIHTSSWGENNPFVKAVNLYNNVDENLKSNLSIKQFKKLLKEQLMSSQ